MIEKNRKKLEMNILSRSKSGLFWLIFFLVLFWELIINIWIRTESTQSQLELAQNRVQLEKLLTYNKALGLELDRLKSEARITDIAKKTLGLISELNSPIIYLQEEITPYE